MSSFQYDVWIDKPPAEVYVALTTQQGIQGWWTPVCDVRSQVGMAWGGMAWGRDGLGTEHCNPHL